jgi:hypothetical protein
MYCNVGTVTMARDRARNLWRAYDQTSILRKTGTEDIGTDISHEGSRA